MFSDSDENFLDRQSIDIKSCGGVSDLEKNQQTITGKQASEHPDTSKSTKESSQSDQTNSDDKPSSSNSPRGKMRHVKKHVIPPPMKLLPKSHVPKEPVKSGTEVRFLELENNRSDSNLLSKWIYFSWLVEPVDEQEKSSPTNRNKEVKNFKSIFFQDLKNSRRNPVVYNRYVDWIQ